MKALIAILSIILFVGCSGTDQKNDSKHSDIEELPEIQQSIQIFGGDTINTIIIEELEWIAENLDIEVEESWCYENKPSNCVESGRLYRWESAQIACQLLGKDWRLPTDDEWKKLANTAGGHFDYLLDKEMMNSKKANETLGIGGKLGFSARRNGWRGSNGGYSDINTVGFYWSSTDLDEVEAWFYIFYPKGGRLTRRAIKKRMGMSCRCVRQKH